MAPPKKAPAPIKKGMKTDDAFVTILKHNYNYARGWEPTAHQGKNIRGVHQTRVAYRRMRSCIKNFRRAIPRELSSEMQLGMKGFASKLGPARDLDVFQTEVLDVVGNKLTPAAGAKKLKTVVSGKRADAYDQVRSAIDGKEYAAFRKEFAAWLKNKPWRKKMSAAQLKKVNMPIEKYAAQEMDRRFSKMLAMGKNRKSMTDDQLHDLRIKGKEMRYACEFFTPLFGKAAFRDFILRLKAVQGVLGTLHDIHVGPELLEGITSGQSDANVKKTVNNILAMRSSDERKLRKSLDGAWKKLESAKRPWGKVSGKGGKRRGRKNRK
ncbi:MAG: CHAD domain-containing protein [Magnetococcales bacterium]|nr:CHAD domain-containing protein [Magnetococcales bacterium]